MIECVDNLNIALRGQRVNLRSKIPFAEQIYKSFQEIAENTPGAYGKHMKQYLRESRLWLTWGWYFEILQKEQNMQEDIALEIIGQFYGKQEKTADFWEELLNVLNEYLGERDGFVLKRKKFVENLSQTAPAVYERLWDTEKFGENLARVVRISPDGEWDRGFQKYLTENKKFMRKECCQLLKIFPVHQWNWLAGDGIERLRNWMDFLEGIVKEVPECREAYEAGVLSFYRKFCTIKWNGVSLDVKSGKRIREMLRQRIMEMKENGTSLAELYLMHLREIADIPSSGVQRLTEFQIFCREYSVERQIKKDIVYQMMNSGLRYREEKEILRYVTVNFQLTGERTVEVDSAAMYRMLYGMTEEEITACCQREIFERDMIRQAIGYAREQGNYQMMGFLMQFL